MNPREKDLEAVDACVFSSDMLHFPAGRERFAHYLARWTKELNETAETDATAAPHEEPATTEERLAAVMLQLRATNDLTADGMARIIETMKKGDTVNLAQFWPPDPQSTRRHLTKTMGMMNFALTAAREQVERLTRRVREQRAQLRSLNEMLQRDEP